MPFDLAEIEIAIRKEFKNEEELFCVLSLREGIIAAMTYDPVDEEMKTYYPFNSKLEPTITPEWAYSYDEIFTELADGAEILYLLDIAYQNLDEIIKTDERFEYNQAGVECYEQQHGQIKIISEPVIRKTRNEGTKYENIGNWIGELNVKGICYKFSKSSKGYFLTTTSKSSSITYRRFDRLSNLLKFAAALEKDREHNQSKNRQTKNGKER